MIEPRVRKAIPDSGPTNSYLRLIELNDQRIREPELDNGGDIAAERSAIHTGLAAYWLEGELTRHGYDRPIALVALGGTGRGEMTPCSDTDFALLLEEPIAGNEFLAKFELKLPLVYEAVCSRTVCSRCCLFTKCISIE